jgi:hypothetical protein
MSEDVIKGRYRGVMANHEVERFRIWEEMGDEMIVSSGRHRSDFRELIFCLIGAAEMVWRCCREDGARTV